MRWSDALLLLASISLVPGPIQASGGGGVIMCPRVDYCQSTTSSTGSGGSGDSGTGSTENQSASGSSNQTVFEQNVYLEFWGTQSSLSLLDSQMLALGSVDSRVRLAPEVVAAAGSKLDITMPISALSNVETRINTSALGLGGGGNSGGGIVMCTGGENSPLTAGTWNGSTIGINFLSIASSPSLWNQPITVKMFSHDGTRGAELVITVSNGGTTLNLKLNPVAAPNAN